MKSKIEIRQAKIEDLEQWWDMEISRDPGNAKSHEYYKKAFIDDNKTGKRITFYAWDGDVIVGQGSVFHNNGRIEINKLELEPEYRGKGISTQIVKYLEKFAKSKGIKEIFIGVEPSEIRNMQIYFHWGYTNFVCIEHDERENYSFIVYSKML